MVVTASRKYRLLTDEEGRRPFHPPVPITHFPRQADTGAASDDDATSFDEALPPDKASSLSDPPVLSYAPYIGGAARNFRSAQSSPDAIEAARSAPSLRRLLPHPSVRPE